MNEKDNQKQKNQYQDKQNENFLSQNVRN